MICNAIYSLLVLIEKLAFFNKQLQGFIISLIQTLRRPFLIWYCLHWPAQTKKTRMRERNLPIFRWYNLIRTNYKTLHEFTSSGSYLWVKITTPFVNFQRFYLIAAVWTRLRVNNLNNQVINNFFLNTSETTKFETVLNLGKVHYLSEQSQSKPHFSNM